MSGPRATDILDGRGRRLVVSLAASWMLLGLVLACSSSPSDRDAAAGDDAPPVDASGDGVAPDGAEPGADTLEAADLPGGAADAVVADPDVVVGAFQVALVPPVEATATTAGEAGYTWVLGQVSDGPTPSMIAWDPFHQVGDCWLYKPRAPFCTACPDGWVCVDEEVCQAYPAPQTVGVVTLTGVQTASGAASFDLKPLAGNYQPTVELLYPGFAEGDPLAVAAEGSDFAPAFTLQAVGIAPLEITTPSFVLTDGQPLPVAWAPAGPLAASRVLVSLEIAHHGGYKGRVDCDVADTGSLVIPAELVDELKALGVAGYPTVSITRASTDQVALAVGRVQLIVSTQVVRPVDIPGLVSCNDDTGCPDGQACGDDLTCH